MFRLSMKRSEWINAIWDPLDGNYIFNMIWSGAPYANTGTRLYPSPDQKTFGVAANPKSFFTALQRSPLEEENLQKFLKFFAERLEWRRADAFQKAKSSPSPAAAKTDSILRQLRFLVRNSLDLGEPKVLEFYNYLTSDASLPDAAAIVYGGIVGGMNREEAYLAVEKNIAEMNKRLDELSTVRLQPGQGGVDLLKGLLRNASTVDTKAPTLWERARSLFGG